MKLLPDLAPTLPLPARTTPERYVLSRLESDSSFSILSVLPVVLSGGMWGLTGAAPFGYLAAVCLLLLVHDLLHWWHARTLVRLIKRAFEATTACATRVSGS
jgi:hypothetical protein